MPVFDDLPARDLSFLGGATPQSQSQSRPLWAVANDLVIEGANAAVGSVKTISDFIDPSSRASRAMDDFIKMGEASQSDVVKAAKRKFSDEVAGAGGITDEAVAAGRYVLENPGLAAAYLAGNVAPMALGVTAASRAAQGVAATRAAARGLSAAEIAARSGQAGMRAGQAAGATLGAAMSGGDAAQQTYQDLTDPTRRDIVLASPEARQLLASGMSEDQAVDAIATTQARKASLAPAALGGVFGATGLERVLAGGHGRGRLATGAIEALQGATEEVATGVSGNIATKQIDPSVDPMKGAGVNAVLGAVYEGVPGVALGGRHEPAAPPPGPLSRAANIAAGPQLLAAPAAQPAEWEVVDDRPRLGGPNASELALGYTPESIDRPIMVDSAGNAVQMPEGFAREKQAEREEAINLGLTGDVRAAQLARAESGHDAHPGAAERPVPRLTAEPETPGNRFIADESGGVRRSTFMEDRGAETRDEEDEALGLTRDVRAAQQRRAQREAAPRDDSIDGEGLIRTVEEAKAESPEYAAHTDLARRAFERAPALTLRVLRDDRIDHAEEAQILDAIIRGRNAQGTWQRLAAARGQGAGSEPAGLLPSSGRSAGEDAEATRQALSAPRAPSESQAGGAPGAVSIDTGPPLRIEPVSEKTFIVAGDTRPHEDLIRSVGGRRNSARRGWIFPKSREAQVRQALGDLLGDGDARTDSPLPAPGAQVAGDLAPGDASDRQADAGDAARAEGGDSAGAETGDRQDRALPDAEPERAGALSERKPSPEPGEREGTAPEPAAEQSVAQPNERGDEGLGSASPQVAKEGAPSGDGATAPEKSPGETSETAPVAEGEEPSNQGDRPVFQRDRGTGMTPAEVSRIADAVRAAWTNGPEVVVVADLKDPRVPEAVRSEDAEQMAGGAQGEPGAAFHGGKVYLVAERLGSAADVVRALSHEVLGHYGLRGLFGKRLSGILEQITRARPSEIRAKLTEYGLKDTASNRLIAAEEVLADLAQTQPEIGFVRRAIAAIRRWLRDLGVNLRLTNDDIIAQFIAPARAFVERGGQAQAGRTSPAFARSDDAFVSEVLAELAQHDELFRYPVSRSATLDGVMADVFPRAKFLGEDTRVDEREESGADARYVFRTPEGKNLYVFERGKEVWIDVSRLEEGERGAGFYAAVMNYAHNAGKRFVGDPAGLSEAAVVRRTSAMLSSALRFGTTEHLDAAAEQLRGIPEKGIAPLKWRGDDLAKVTSLIESFLSTLYTQFPGLGNYRYDFRGNRFVDRRGRPLDAARLERGEGSPAGRQSRAGQATLRRGIFLQSLVASESGKRPELLENILARGRALASGELRAMFSRAIPSRQQISKNIADLFQSSKGFNWWHRTIGTQYEKAQRNPLFRRVFEASQDFLSAVSDFGNRAADEAPTLLPKMQGLRDVLKRPTSKKDLAAIARPIFDGTLVDSDPAKGAVWTDAQLRDDYGLNERQIGLYREFRAAVDRSLDDMGKTDLLRYVGDDAREVRDEVIGASDITAAAKLLADHLHRMAETAPGRVDALRSTADTVLEKAARINDLKTGGYAPLMRFGRYSVYITRQTDGEPEQIYFGMFDTQREANRVARQFREDPQYADADVAQGVVSQDAFKLFQGVNPETLELFADVAGVEQTELFQSYLKLARANRSAMKRLIHRKGVAGFSEDMTRVLAAFITSNARAGAANLHIGEMNAAAAEIPKEQGDVKDEAVRLAEFVRGTNDPSSRLRGLLFAQYLGGSVASALVNMTQPITMTYPYLAQFTGAAKAGTMLTKAMRDAVTGVGSDENLRLALKRAEREGIVSPQEIHHLYNEAGIGLGRQTWVRRATFLWGSMFSAAEQFNRRATFIAAYRIARERGDPDAFGFAEKAVVETQGIYNRGNRPNWARNPVGATLLTFKQFSIAYLEFLKRLPPKQQALALAVLVLAAGLDEFPFADDLDDVIDTLAQAMGDNWSTKRAKREWLASALGKDGAEFMLRGMSTIPGVPIDVSARLGLGNLIPGTGLLRGSTSDKTREVTEVLGAPGSFFQTVAAGAEKALAGDVKGAGLEVLPLAFRNLEKSIDMYQTGMYRDSKGRRVMDVDAYDAMVKMIGFQPAEVAAAQRKAGIVYESAALVRNTKARISEQLAQARFEHDPEKLREARDALRDWNRKNPEARILIDESAINKRVKAMRATRAERLIKSTPKEIRRSIAEQL